MDDNEITERMAELDRAVGGITLAEDRFMRQRIDAGEPLDLASLELALRGWRAAQAPTETNLREYSAAIERLGNQRAQRRAEPGDVIQLNPHEPLGQMWGPLLLVVDLVEGWGVRGDAFIPQERNEPPGIMPMRVEHGGYVVIGKAEWRFA